jgi:hypothetical protein
MEISEGRLALDKLEMHQAAGCVIHKHQQGALRPAIFEPPMLAAVDLHQLADTLAPMTWLMNLLPPLLAVGPNPGLDHSQPKGLTPECDIVNLAQLLRRQGQAKIPIPLANDRQRLGANRLRLALVARTTTPLRDQARRTLGPVRLQQSATTAGTFLRSVWT